MSKIGIFPRQQDMDYSVGDKVMYQYGGYECKTAHNSGTTFDITNWTRIFDEQNVEVAIADLTLDNSMLSILTDCATAGSDITITIPDASTLMPDTRYIHRIDSDYNYKVNLQLANSNDSLYSSAYDHMALDLQGQGVIVFLDKETGKYRFANLSGVAGDLPLPILFRDGFEDGDLSNWNVVNDTVNVWIVGSADRYEGTYSAYISNNGADPTYTNNNSEVSHIYVDVAIPVGINDLVLEFAWKGQGEVNYDFMKVYNVPTTTTPVAGTQLTSGQIGATQYNNSTTRQEEIIHIGSADAGTTRRFVFSWRNDGSVGGDSIRLDNVKFSYAP